VSDYDKSLHRHDVWVGVFIGCQPRSHRKGRGPSFPNFWNFLLCTQTVWATTKFGMITHITLHYITFF